MAFIPAKSESIDTYLLGTHTDYLNVWASVHDEVDFHTPSFLLNPIMKTVVNQASLKDLLDKYKIPGLAMTYDVEFDNTLSWTAKEKTDMYKYPLNHTENLMFDLWQKSIKNELKPNIKTEDVGRIITQPIHLANKEWLEMMSGLPKGMDKVLIQTSEDQFFEYERLVEYPK